MEIKVIVSRKQEEGKSEVPFPQYAKVVIQGDRTIVKDLFEKIQRDSEDYTFD